MDEETPLDKPVLARLLNMNTSSVFENGHHSVPSTTAKLFLSQELTLKQIAWFLEHDKIESDDDIKSKCTQPGCLAHLKLEIAVSDEDLMVLVQKNTSSLAELYRKGKSRGLIQAAAKGYA